MLETFRFNCMSVYSNLFQRKIQTTEGIRYPSPDQRPAPQ